MPHDDLGNSLSAAEQSTLRAVDDFIEGYLAYETRAEDIIRAADADPACCIANVYAGFLRMLLELRREADPEGVPINMALAGVYLDLGLPVLGEQARARGGNPIPSRDMNERARS